MSVVLCCVVLDGWVSECCLVLSGWVCCVEWMDW